MRDLIDTTEMYLRTVFDLEEEGIPPLRARIVERLGHSGPTVSQTVGRMERDGLLTLADDRRIELTELGRLRATQVTRKHRIAERLLSDVIGLDLEYIHEEACRWEHVMSERVERKILEMLPEHAESPYGMPIPGLDEFGESENTDFSKGLATLVEVAPTDGSEIRTTLRRIAESAQFDQDTLTLITATGLLPGEAARIRREDDRIIMARADGVDTDGVSLPLDVAVHVFVQATD